MSNASPGRKSPNSSPNSSPSIINRGSSPTNSTASSSYPSKSSPGGVSTSCCSHGSCSRSPASHRADKDVEIEFKHAMSSLSAEQIKETGNKLYRMGRFQDALQLYEKAVLIEPTQASLRANRAAALSALGRVHEAIKDCQDAIGLDLNYTRAHQRLAGLLIRAGRMDEAKAAIRMAPREVMDEEIAKLNMVESHVKRLQEIFAMKDWAGLLVEAEIALAAGADCSPRILKWKAEALLNMRRLDEADQTIQLVVKYEFGKKLYPMDSNTSIVRAKINIALGRFDIAITDSTAALAEMVDKSGARELLQISGKLHELRTVGNKCFRSGDIDGALNAYTEGLRIDSHNPILLCNRAACLSRKESWQAALRDADLALKWYPNYSKGMLRRTACLMKLAMWNEAVAMCQELLKYIPNDPEILKVMAEAKVNLSQKNGGPILPRSIVEGGLPVEINDSNQFSTIISSFDLVVVDFFATWCGPCTQIAPLVNKLAKQFRAACFIKVDIDKNRVLARAEAVQSVPTFKIFKRGMLVETILGANGMELERLVNKFSRSV